jgi:hypothetical protein
MLTSSTDEAMYQGIQVDSVKQTFQDTIKVARHLGLYLWIDSIYIMQDSTAH